MRQELDFKEFERQQQDERHDEDDQRCRRRQSFDPEREPALDGIERQPRHSPRHHRRELFPQPSLEQEDDDEQDKKRTQQPAYYLSSARAPKESHGKVFS